MIGYTIAMIDVPPVPVENIPEFIQISAKLHPFHDVAVSTCQVFSLLPRGGKVRLE